mgnify:CR=1 FL=1
MSDIDPLDEMFNSVSGEDTGIEDFDSKFERVEVKPKEKPQRKQRNRNKNKPEPASESPPAVSDTSTEEELTSVADEEKAPSNILSGLSSMVKKTSEKITDKKHSDTVSSDDSIKDIEASEVVGEPAIEDGTNKGKETDKLFLVSAIGLVALGVISFFVWPMFNTEIQPGQDQTIAVPEEPTRTLSNSMSAETSSTLNPMVTQAEKRVNNGGEALLSSAAGLIPEAPSIDPSIELPDESMLDENGNLIEENSTSNETPDTTDIGEQFFTKFSEETNSENTLTSMSSPEPIVESPVSPDVSVETDLIDPVVIDTPEKIDTSEKIIEEAAGEQTDTTSDATIKELGEARGEIASLKASVESLNKTLNRMMEKQQEAEQREQSRRKLAYHLPDVSLTAILYKDGQYQARINLKGEEPFYVVDGSKVRQWTIERVEPDRIFMVFGNYSRIVSLPVIEPDQEMSLDDNSVSLLPEVDENRSGIAMFGEDLPGEPH